MRLTVVIPSKNEPYLAKTVEDLRAHAVLADTEILYAEDTGRGQRGTTNDLVALAQGTHIMKTDAHCSFSLGYDKAILEAMEEKSIVAPILMPLDGESWTINGKKQMKQFVFDTNMIMQHAEGEAGDSMCLQGSCFAVAKEHYYAWELGDESMGSWGGQGTELGIKAFLNGGTCKTIATAFYGHVFRHSDADFPYERGEHPGKRANEELIRRYRNEKIYLLIKRFGFPADWSLSTASELLVN